MRHRLTWVVTVLLVAGSVLAPAQATSAAPLSYPEMHGRTVITSQGTAGVVLRVPTTVGLDRGGINLKVEGSDAAYVQLSPEPPCDRMSSWTPADDPNAWCADYQMFFMKDSALSPIISPPARDPKIRGGLLHVYIVSDGPVTLTLTVNELVGETDIAATGDLFGHMKRMPKACPQEAQLGCSNFGYGGVVGQAEVPGLVGAWAYAQKPASVPVGTAAAHPCIYPNRGNPAAPLDPGAHSTGCDFADDTNSADAQNTRNFYLMWTATTPQTDALAVVRFEEATQTQHYTGFTAHQAAADQPLNPSYGRIGGYGLWMGRTITCPSGDFAAC
jgi:hypothetical protein